MYKKLARRSMGVLLTVVLVTTLLLPTLYLTIFADETYTVESYGASDSTVAAFVTENHTKNLLIDKTYYTRDSDGTIPSSAQESSHASNYPNFVDGKINKGTHANAAKFIKSSAPNFQVVYDLGQPVEVDQILLAQFNNASYAAKKYNIYLGMSKDTLFDPEKSVKIEYDNNHQDISQVFTFKENNKPVARYIAFEFVVVGATAAGISNTHGRTDDVLVRVDQFGVYGTPVTVEPYTVESYGASNSTVADFVAKNHTKNLLVDKTYYTRDSDGTIPSSAQESSHASNYPKFVDGKINQNTHANAAKFTKGSAPNFQVVYDLGQYVEVDQILLAQFNNAGYAAKKYNIYLGMSKTTLFDSEKSVKIEYDNSDQDISQVFTFSEYDKPVARYIAFEFVVVGATATGISNTHGRSDDVFVRVDQFGVYGTKVNVDEPPEVYATSTVCTTGINTESVSERTKDNLLKNLLPRISDDAGVSDKQAENTFFNLYNGQINNDSHVTFQNYLRDHAPTRITYDLYQTVPIDEILFVSYYHKTSNYTTQKYEIFVSDSRETLYEDKNRVIYYDNRNKWASTSDDLQGAGQWFTFTGDKPVGRYVGIRIIDMNPVDNYLRIDQLGVYSAGKTPYDAQVAQSFTDPDTGIVVSVMRKEAGDLFNEVVSVKVEKIALSGDILKTAGQLYLNPLTAGYRIRLYNAEGTELTGDDLDERIVRLNFPKVEGDSNGKIMVASYAGTTLSVETTYYDPDHITANVIKISNVYMLCQDMLNHGFDSSGQLSVDRLVESDGGNSTSPSTGIEWNYTPWLLLLAVASTAVISTAVIFKKRGNKNA